MSEEQTKIINLFVRQVILDLGQHFAMEGKHAQEQGDMEKAGKCLATGQLIIDYLK